MEELKNTFIKKCADFAVKPVQKLLDDLSSSEETNDINLCGSQKELFNARVQPMQVFALCEALAPDTLIVSLDLSTNFLNDMAAQAVAGLIKANHTLRFINLGSNDIGPVGAGHLASALSAPDCGLQALSLNSNPLEDAGVMALAEALRTSSSLYALDLSNVHMGVQGLVAVCSAMGAEGEGNTSVQVMDIGAPIIHMQQDTTVLSIARMLASNTTLTELGLSKHGLVDSQFETLVSYGLLRNSSLTSLDLRANKLSGFSGAQLERLIADRQRLESLNLSHNMLGDAGALGLARCLPYCHWLTALDLRSNNMGEQGLVALAEVLPLAAHLQTVLLWGNHMGPVACRALADALEQTNGSLVTDIKPYEVDGRFQVALVDVESEA